MRRLILPAILSLLLPAWPASAIDLPARRAGLWEIEVHGGMNLPTTQQCIDAATDRRMQALATGIQGACSKQDVQRSGNVITVDAVCKVGDRTMVSHAVITGDFDKAYTVRMTSTRSGGDNKKKSAATSLIVTARWLGPCRPGQRPGDVIIAGQNLNIRNLRKMLGGH